MTGAFGRSVLQDVVVGNCPPTKAVVANDEAVEAVNREYEKMLTQVWESQTISLVFSKNWKSVIHKVATVLTCHGTRHWIGS